MNWICLIGNHKRTVDTWVADEGGSPDTYETWEVLGQICPRCAHIFYRKVFTV